MASCSKNRRSMKRSGSAVSISFSNSKLTSNDFYWTLRQRLQEGPAIGPGQDATVEDDNYSLIALCSDQTADALSQFQDRFGQRIFSERIASALLDQFKFRFDQWMVGHGKWQTRNNYIRERLAGNIDAHPKTVGAKKNAAWRGLELI